MSNGFTLTRQGLTQANVFVVDTKGKPFLTFKCDGSIEIGEGYTHTEAGDAFIEYLRPMFARMIEHERSKEAA